MKVTIHIKSDIWLDDPSKDWSRDISQWARKVEEIIEDHFNAQPTELMCFGSVEWEVPQSVASSVRDLLSKQELSPNASGASD